MKKTLLLAVLPLVLLAAGNTAVRLPQNEMLYDADGDKLAENLELLIAETQEPLPVIVTLNQAATQVAVADLESTFGFAASCRWNIIPGFAATLTPAQIQTLARLQQVKQIEYDNPVQTCMCTASYSFGVTKARADFGVDGDRDGNKDSYTRDDVVIAVIDCGIDANHCDLNGGKVIGWQDFVNGKPDPYDDNSHGTHCASICAGSGDACPAYTGVAPAAALVGVKVLNWLGSGPMSAVISGVDWTVANKDVYGVDIISMSLGSGGSSNGTDALCVACNNAVAEGIVVCVAAGNSGPGQYSIGSPAAAEDVITIGAMADCGEKGFYLADFSSRGPTADGRIKPDVCAPGVDITAALANTKFLHIKMSGTSMATPFAAGEAALVLDANPSMTPAEVKNCLESTCQNWGPKGKDIDYGYGRTRAHKAVKVAGGFSGKGPAHPEHARRTGEINEEGKFDVWKVCVNSIEFPFAVTMILPYWPGTPDFALYLLNPLGIPVAFSTGAERQEEIGFQPLLPGNYRLCVRAKEGVGPYLLDFSCANASSATLVHDNYLDPDKKVSTQAGNDIPVAEVRAQQIGQGRASFELSLIQAEQVSLRLHDATGRVVRSTELAGSRGRNRVEFSGLSAGVYFYQVESRSLSDAGKITVLR